MNNDSTIPSQLGPLHTVPATLVPAARSSHRSEPAAIGPTGKLLVAFVLVAALLLVARYFTG